MWILLFFLGFIMTQCLPPDGDRSLSPTVDVDGRREWRHLVVANDHDEKRTYYTVYHAFF